jgi:DNA-binding MarR family transcriptional regulator
MQATSLGEVPPNRLSPLEFDAWGGLLRVHSVLYRELERRLVKSNGMSISSYDVLLRLTWAGSSGLRMSELATQLLMTTGGLTRLVDRLERDGLITRTRDAHDLRGYVARITPAGRRAFRSANQRHLADIRELFLDHVTKEQLGVLAEVWRSVKAANADLDQTPMPSELVGRQAN